MSSVDSSPQTNTQETQLVLKENKRVSLIHVGLVSVTKRLMLCFINHAEQRLIIFFES